MIFNLWTLLGFMALVILISVSIAGVGMVPPCRENVWTYWDVMWIAITLVAVFVLGFMGGRESKDG
jgi:hypothetical protein